MNIKQELSIISTLPEKEREEALQTMLKQIAEESGAEKNPEFWVELYNMVKNASMKQS